jgi:hypothetical protein
VSRGAQTSGEPEGRGERAHRRPFGCEAKESAKPDRHSIRNARAPSGGGHGTVEHNATEAVRPREPSDPRVSAPAGTAGAEHSTQDPGRLSPPLPMREPPNEEPFICIASDQTLAIEQSICGASMLGVNPSGAAMNAIEAMRREKRAVPPPIELRSPEHFEFEAGDLQALPAVKLRSWHPSKRFAETLEACAVRPDTNLPKTPPTDHLLVLWSHTPQLARARAAGASFPIEHGPSPYPSSYGRRFQPEPQSMRDLHQDPMRTWDSQTDWYQCMCREIGEVEKGYRFRYSRIPGGRRGLRGSIQDLKWQYRRVSWI